MGIRYGTKYTKTVLEPIVKEAISLAQVLKKLELRLTGGNYLHIKNRIKQFNIDTSHFLGARVNSGERHKGGPEKLVPEQIFVINRCNGRREEVKKLRRALTESGIEEKCSECNITPIWNGKKLTLQIDHINGNCLDNRKKNLRFLCPNCHSQTENFGKTSSLCGGKWNTRR